MTEDYKNDIKETSQRTWENIRGISAQLDQWIITANIGLVGLSAGFLQITDNPVEAIILLFLSWIFFLVSILIIVQTSCLIITDETTVIKAGREIISGNMTEKMYKDLRRAQNRSEILNKMTKNQYPLSIFFLLLGVVSLGIFSAYNVTERNKRLNQEKLLDQQVKQLEIEKIKIEIEELKSKL